LSLEDSQFLIHLQDVDYNRRCEPKHNFYTIFKNVIEVHIVQLIILFYKRTEIHLNDRKYKICLKNCIKFICRLKCSILAYVPKIDEKIIYLLGIV
jgi:hypothetical protein